MICFDVSACIRGNRRRSFSSVAAFLSRFKRILVFFVCLWVFEIVVLLMLEGIL